VLCMRVEDMLLERAGSMRADGTGLRRWSGWKYA
jgi:hypothetical protein